MLYINVDTLQHIMKFIKFLLFFNIKGVILIFLVVNNNVHLLHIIHTQEEELYVKNVMVIEF